MKHGLSVEEIESLFLQPIMILPAYSSGETRLKAVGRTVLGSYVFLVFTVREKTGSRYIRPISARYMHSKEVRHYEEENPGFSN